MSIRQNSKQAGFSLTEALVSFVVLTGGLLALASYQAGLFANSADNKARSEALSLAEQRIEEFREYTFGDEDNYIDLNDDGVMDADGSYSDNPIAGQNAVFNRSWDIATGSDGKRIDVTVSWTDAANETNSVLLAASLPWISPRGAVDQLSEISPPSLQSPAGRARLGEGNLLLDYPADVFKVGDFEGGLSTYRYGDDLLLVTGSNDVVLTLDDACVADSGCTEFVRISGTVYLDKANVRPSVDIADIRVIASDAAYCERYTPTGSITNPPLTANGDYEYYNYTCYLGGGWHGNIGFVTADGLLLNDKVCQGDPTSVNGWEEPVIALRRAYRGMLSKSVNGTTQFYSHGIRDAALFTGQDFVFTGLAADVTEGSACEGSEAPMTRVDSSAGTLFEGVPTDFVCLNSDDNNDSAPDYLDSYDTSTYSAGTTCPYDPTDPPVRSHTISGVVSILSLETLDLTNFAVNTSDGPGNCDLRLSEALEGYEVEYSCTVYDWGTGWQGYIEVQPNSKYMYCADERVEFSAVTSDQSSNFQCITSSTVEFGGTVSFLTPNASITSVVVADALTGLQGFCRFDQSAYRCLLPYDTIGVDVTLTVEASDHVCGATEGVFTFSGLTVDGSPFNQNIVIAQSWRACP